MRGAEAAEQFYGSGRFTRVRAMPVTVLKLLQDFGSAQFLHGESHRHRKAMFMRLCGQAAADRVAADMVECWRRRLPLTTPGDIILFDEVRLIVTESACRWAGVSLSEDELRQRALELSDMIESTGSVGPRNWRAMLRRARTERWARGIIAAVRNESAGR
jgi:fatty-acid peroxygenase